MNIITHALIGWTFGQRWCRTKRDAGLVTLAAVVPDIDALGAPFEVLTRGTAWEVTWFSDYHHILGHNLLAAVATTIAIALLADDRFKGAAAAFFLFHLHLLCDVIGAKGPDGEQWPIPYLTPFSSEWQIVWSGQWEINAWPNIALTIVLMFYSLKLIRDQGYSFLWFFSKRADTALVATLRHRFPPA